MTPDRPTFKPAFIYEPILPFAIQQLPRNLEGLIAEAKLNGMRALAHVEKRGDILIVSRSGRDITAQFPDIVEDLRYLSRNHTLDLDGEIIDPPGKTEKQRGQVLRRSNMKGENALYDSRLHPLLYTVFDLMAIDGKDLSQTPLLARKRILARILPRVVQIRSSVLFVPHVTGESIRGFAKTNEEKGLEGIVIKRADSFYQRPNSPSQSPWQKLKF